MATERDKEVIREFLVSLGFQVDAIAQKKFSDYLGGLGKLAGQTGTAIAGVAVAAEAMVQVFASQMEKLYYASQRTRSSVTNIKALQFAGEQIGLTAETVGGALETMSSALRRNPGLYALLNNLGVKTENRNNTEVMVDLMKQLVKLPSYIALQWADMFGIPEEMFMNIKNNFPQFLASMEKYRSLVAGTGLDQDKAAGASREYMNVLRELWTTITAGSDVIAMQMLPAFKTAMGAAKEFMLDMVTMRSDIVPFEAWGQRVKAVLWGIGNVISWLSRNLSNFGAAWADLSMAYAAGTNAEKQAHLKDAWKHLKSAGSAFMSDVVSPTSPEEKAVSKMLGTPGAGVIRRTDTPSAGLFGNLEAFYGLPRGLLDRMWSRESGRGAHMVGPPTKTGERALGHFQFMSETAKQYGLSDPFNLRESATSAAAYMHDLLARYNGNLQMALAAYNWGPGNVDKYGLGRAPSETRKYVAEIAGKGANLSQSTTIVVQGAGDPDATARAVGREQGRVNGDLVRNFVGATR